MSISVLLYYFSTINENVLLFTLDLEVMFNPRTFSQVLATVIKILLCSILYFEVYNFLSMECKVSS